MDSLHTFYLQHNFGLWLALVVAAIALALSLFAVHMRSRKVARRMDDIFQSLSSDNMAAMLVEYLGIVRNNMAVARRVKSEHDEIMLVMPSVIRHVGLVRFSPFHDTGGDQSFSLAMMDGKQDGVILTALHSRTDSRLYAKPIQGGESPYALTPEEMEAIDRAKHGAPVEMMS